MVNKDAGQEVGSGTLLLILIQVASRAFTFIGNQFLLRFLSPSLLGIAVQLELVSVTGLYLTRESLRVALQRQQSSTTAQDESSTGTEHKDTRGEETQSVVNLSYLAVVLGFIVSTLLGFSYLRSAQAEVAQSPYFDVSFRVYALATLAELLAEPAFVVIQQRGMFKERARAETTGAMARCFIACTVAVLGHKRDLAPSILPFAAGQVAYGTTLLGLYCLPVLRLSRTERFSLLPQKISSAGTSSTYYIKLFHKTILSLAMTMYLQSVFKLLLTQGDALIMTFLSSLSGQGAFALASNYGGLLARLILQPVEESSRNTFGRLLAPEPASTASSTPSITNTKAKRTASANTTKSKSDVKTAIDYLSRVLKLYMLFSLPLITLAPPLLPLLVPFILAPQWRTPSTISLLQLYCYYIPLTAVNGILDAFVTSVATPAQLRRQSLWMVVFTTGYAVSAWVLMKLWGLGSLGIVGANMMNMTLRTAWGVWFLKTWIRESQNSGEKMWESFAAETVPSLASIVTGMLVVGSWSFSGSSVVDAYLRRPDLSGLALWLAGAGFLGATMMYTEGSFLVEVLESVIPDRLAGRMLAFLRKRNMREDKSKTM